MTPDIQLSEDKISEMPSKTFAIDFKKGNIRRTADELDAVVQAAIIALQTERGNFKIFGSDYGSDLHLLIAKDKNYVFSEAKRMIKSALYSDLRITAVRDFKMDGKTISFTIDTIFGSSEIQTEVTS